MKRLIVLAAVVICVVIGLAGCNEPAPVQVDAPQIASSLKWLGVCAVLCSVCGAIGLIIASNNRRK